MEQKKLFCVMGTNGSGKTALMKELIKRHQWVAVDLYKDGFWNVLQNGSRSSRTLLVGYYDGRAVCGGDLIRGEKIFRALKKAVAYPVSRILVESLKFHKKEIFDQLVDFCRENSLELNVIMISIDPVECHYRVLGRDEKTKYNASLIMERFIEAKYLWATIPDPRKHLVKNLNSRTLSEVGEELAGIVFSK